MLSLDADLQNLLYLQVSKPSTRLPSVAFLVLQSSSMLITINQDQQLLTKSLLLKMVFCLRCTETIKAIIRRTNPFCVSLIIKIQVAN